MGLRVHHYVWGLGILLTGIVTASLPIFAVGLGLSLDELTFVAIGGRTHEDNYSLISLLGTAILVGLTFLLRHWLIGFIDG